MDGKWRREMLIRASWINLLEPLDHAGQAQRQVSFGLLKAFNQTLWSTVVERQQDSARFRRPDDVAYEPLTNHSVAAAFPGELTTNFNEINEYQRISTEFINFTN